MHKYEFEELKESLFNKIHNVYTRNAYKEGYNAGIEFVLTSISKLYILSDKMDECEYNLLKEYLLRNREYSISNRTEGYNVALLAGVSKLKELYSREEVSKDFLEKIRAYRISNPGESRDNLIKKINEEIEKHFIPENYKEADYLNVALLKDYSEKSYKYGQKNIFMPKSQVRVHSNKIYINDWYQDKLLEELEAGNIALETKIKNAQESKIEKLNIITHEIER